MGVIPITEIEFLKLSSAFNKNSVKNINENFCFLSELFLNPLRDFLSPRRKLQKFRNKNFLIPSLTKLIRQYGDCSSVAEYSVVVRTTWVRFPPLASQIRIERGFDFRRLVRVEETGNLKDSLDPPLASQIRIERGFDFRRLVRVEETGNLKDSLDPPLAFQNRGKLK